MTTPTRPSTATTVFVAVLITAAVVWLWVIYEAQCWPDPGAGAGICDVVFPTDLAVSLAWAAR